MSETPEASASPDFHCGLVAIVGRPNVGKSTLSNRLVGQKISIVSRKAQTTRHRIHAVLTDGNAQFVFVDTPGFQRKHGSALNRVMNRTVTQALADVDLVFLLIEAGRIGPDDREVVELLPEGARVVLVINKIDALPGRRYAVVVDEAHSSQSGEAAKDLRLVLGGGEGPTA